MDWHGIKYTLDILVPGLNYPTIFNYPGFIEWSYKAVDWAHTATLGDSGQKAFNNFIGLSYDFEGNEDERALYYNNPLQNWDLAPLFANKTNPPWSYNGTNATSWISYVSWIGNNEQKRREFQ